MSGIGKGRRELYHWGKILGDVRAIERATKSGSAAPIGRRIVRRKVWRTVGRLMRRSGL